MKSRLFTARKCVSQEIIFRRWSSSDSSDVIRYFERNYVLKFCCLVRSFHVYVRWDLGHELAFYSCFQPQSAADNFSIKNSKAAIPPKKFLAYNWIVKLASWVITTWTWIIDEYLQHCADCLLSALLMSTHANIYDLLDFGVINSQLVLSEPKIPIRSLKIFLNASALCFAGTERAEN